MKSLKPGPAISEKEWRGNKDYTPRVLMDAQVSALETSARSTSRPMGRNILDLIATLRARESAKEGGEG